MKNINIKSKNFWISASIRLLLLVGAYELFLLYYGPLRVKVINAGNLFGLSVALLLVLLSVFLTPIKSYVKRLWNNKKFKPLLLSLTAVLLVFVSVFLGTLGSVIKKSAYSATNESTVIVLGCRIWGSTPSSALRLRVKAGADYLNKNPNAVAILSGGQGSDENLSEAECMFNLMLEEGIDENRLYLEDKSTSTDENIKNSLKIIKENNLSKNVAVATTDYHQKRALMICRKNGLTPSSLPSPSGKDVKATFFTREVFGIFAQWIKMMK